MANSIVLYINGELIETDEKTVIAYNFQVNNVAQLEKRNNSYTSSFKIPKTPGNKRKFNWLGQAGNQSLTPYELLSTVIIDGSFHIKDGFSIIEEGGKNDWTLRVIYGLIDLKTSIDGLSIRQLDWSGQNFTFTADKPITFLNRTDIAIPLLNSGESIIDENEVYSELLTPCVYYRHLWDKIFSEAGFSFTSDFIDNDAKFNASAISANSKIDVESSTKLQYVKTYNAGYPTNTSQTANLGATDVKTFLNVNLPDEIYNKGFTILQLGGTSGTQVGSQRTTQLKIDLSFEVVATFGLSPVSADFEFQIWNIDQNTFHELKTIQYPDPNLTNIYFPVRLNGSTIINVEQGDVLLLRCVATRTSAVPVSPVGQQGVCFYRFSKFYLDIVNLTDDIIFDDLFFDFSKFLPDIQQFDFIKATMQQFGLVPIITSSKNIEVIRMEDLLSGEFGFIDWTNKLHDEESEVYKLGDYGKLNHLLYEYDTDERQEGFADGSFSLDIWQLPDEKTLFKSIFLASFEEGIVGGQLVSNLEMFVIEQVDDGAGGTMDAIRYKGKDKAYCLTIERFDAPIDLTFTGIGSGSSTGKLNLKFAKSEPLYWDELIGEHYPMIIKINERPLVKEVNLLLNVNDINSLDLTKLIYFKQYQTFFYINKITNWQKGKLCKAEIVRVK